MSYHLENSIVSWQLLLETGRYKREVLPYTTLVLLLFPECPLLASVKSRMLGQISCCYSSCGSKFHIKHLRYFGNNSCIFCSGGVWAFWSFIIITLDNSNILSFTHRSDYQTQSAIKNNVWWEGKNVSSTFKSYHTWAGGSGVTFLAIITHSLIHLMWAETNWEPWYFLKGTVSPVREHGGIWDFPIWMKVGRRNEQDKKMCKTWSLCTVQRWSAHLPPGGT